MSRKNKRVKKLTFEGAEDDNVQLTGGANINPYGASRGHSPTPICDGSGTEDEDDPASLTLLEIRGELEKANARLNDVETRVAEHEDKLQNTDEILSEILTMQEKLQPKLTSLEAYSRMESLRLYGVPEGAESGAPSMAQFVEKLLRENLAIPPSTS